MDNLFFYLLPILTAVNLIMLIVWTYKCRREFDSLFNNAGKKTFFAVVFIFCLSLFLKLILVVPKHLYYNDEFYYMITAKNILLHINVGPYLKSSGWSVIIAIMFAVFGINNYVAIGTSIFFGALTTINIFLLVYFIFKDRYLAILSAVIFSIMPDHIFFSATAERSVVSIFFVTFSVLAMLLYFQNERKNLLWLSLLGISFASQIRPENYIFLALFVIGFYIFLKRWPDFKDNIWFIAACLCLPNLIWNCHYHSGLIINPAHSSYFNTVKCFLNLFDGSLYPLLFILLFSTGFLCLWYRKALYNLFIFLGFLALCLIYSYDWEGITLGYGFYTKTRFYICLYPFLIIWFAAGVSFFLDRFKNKKIRHCVFLALSIALLFLYLPYLGNAEYHKQGSGQILETKILGIAESQIPPECAVIVAYPEILGSTTNIETVDINEFIFNDSYQKYILNHYKCVLFFEDYPMDEYRIDSCNMIKHLFYLKPVKSYSIDRGQKYTFYKIFGKPH